MILFVYLAERVDYPHSGAISRGVVQHTSKTKVLFSIAILLLIAVGGLRYYVGADYGHYYRNAYLYARYWIERLKELNEPGFAIICKIASLVSDDGAYAIFLVELVTIGLAGRIILKYTDRLLLAISFFVFLGCWQASFNAVRQCLACSIVFCGWKYLRENKFWKYAIVVFIAYLCHKSAIIMIVPYFLVNRTITLKNIIILILTSVLVSYSYNRVFALTEALMGENAENVSTYLTARVNILRTLVALTPAIYFLLAYKRFDKDSAFYMNLLLVHGALSVASSGSAYLALIYTSPFCAIAIPEMTKKDPNRKIVLPVMYLLFFAYWLVSLNSASNIPFRWIWERGI